MAVQHAREGRCLGWAMFGVGINIRKSRGTKSIDVSQTTLHLDTGKREKRISILEQIDGAKQPVIAIHSIPPPSTLRPRKVPTQGTYLMDAFVIITWSIYLSIYPSISKKERMESLVLDGS